MLIIKSSTLLTLIILLLSGCDDHNSRDYFIQGVELPEILLNGTWKISTAPQENFWKDPEAHHNWGEIEVPGEVMMQGIPIKHDESFACRKEVLIPKDYHGKQIIVQFDGVYSYARVWVNGQYVRDHSGGFTRWDCDISEFVSPGETCILDVEITDKADEISYASGYAKHQIGGILRDVRLLALPQNHPIDITIQTDLDEHFADAILHISGRTRLGSEQANISFALFDSEGKKQGRKKHFMDLSGSKDFEYRMPVKAPLKWDAEHPNLYQLEISMTEQNKLVWKKTIPVGFREVEIKGNQLLVNGREVKLRGACRHDIHPLLGRVSTPEYEEKDVLLAKEANMNFIRTSHYPPTENFLRLCDIHGLYVEDETAVCFVGSHRTAVYYPGASESDTLYTQRYLSQLDEMVLNHKNHPSIIIWSIGNENSFGSNFANSYHRVYKLDGTRPVIFSYPGHVPDSVKSYDILSMHYPDLSGTMDQIGVQTRAFGYKKMPVIFDEWAHVACYNNQTVKEDPNIRDFWGMSLDSMWQKTFNADGGLGGAIWGMIDETFMLPDSIPGYNEWWGIIDAHVIPAEYSGHTIGYGEWGIIDTWRRKKPEFWNTKKAYSPVKILNTRIDDYKPGSGIHLDVHNRYDHTNLDELRLTYVYGGQSYHPEMPDIEPHTQGILELPVSNWQEDEEIKIEFSDRDGYLIDAYVLKRKQTKKPMVASREEVPTKVEDTGEYIIVHGKENTSLSINKRSGLIEEISNDKKIFKLSGPYLRLRTRGAPVIYSYHHILDHHLDWKLTEFKVIQETPSVKYSIAGSYSDGIHAQFIISISSDGEITSDYTVSGIPKEYIRELGIMFKLENEIDSVQWRRDPYWSYYPLDHLSSAQGNAPLYSTQISRYRQEPGKAWKDNSKSFYYDGIGDEISGAQLTNAARATKENIYEYSLIRGEKTILTVFGEGNTACRLEKHGELLHLNILNQMDYVDLSWGNHQRNILIDGAYSNQTIVKLRL